jgi:hypothetical protein
MLDGMDLFNASTREKLAWVESAEPGMLCMSVLLSIDVAQLDPDDAVSYVQAHDRLASWWASLQVQAIVAAADAERRIDEYPFLDRRPDKDEERTVFIEDVAREEIAAATRWSLSTTHSRLESARLLYGPLLATWQSLELGEISPSHVSIIVDAARRLPGRWGQTDAERQEFAAACDALQGRVLRAARRGTLAATRDAARRAVLEIDAAGERRRREAARCTRSVFVSDDEDGMSTLIARLTTESAHALMSAINNAAESIDPAGIPTIDERRADALCALVLGAHSSESGSVTIRAQLDVVIDLTTLLGLDDNAAVLHGAGPISADVVRDLLADPEVSATIRRLVADPISGHLIDAGRRRYEVPRRLRDFIVARDQHCRFPGCRRRARTCQVDHAQPWDDGGETSAANLGTLCVRHHQLKTHAGWDVRESSADGSCVWTSPQGRTYYHSPEPILVARETSGVSPPAR